MKHSRSKVFLLLALLSSATTLLGRPQLKNLDIQVVLAHNGDAYITETRTMDIDSGILTRAVATRQESVASSTSETAMSSAGDWVTAVHVPILQAIRSQTWSRPSTMPTALTICSLPKASHQVLTTSN